MGWPAIHKSGRWYEAKRNTKMRNDTYAKSIGLTVSMKKNMVIGFVNGQRVKLLTDTGAWISCVTSKFVAKAKVDGKKLISTDNVQNISGVGGEIHKVFGKIELQIKIQGFHMNHTFYKNRSVHHSSSTNTILHLYPHSKVYV